MSWGTATMILAAVTVILLGGCGGGGPAQPEEEIAAAVQREESLRSELLLAEAEVARTWVREAIEFEGNPAKVARAKRAGLREARQIAAKCHDGNGLESCESLDAIEEIVDELRPRRR